jgi:hypothetical protein
LSHILREDALFYQPDLNALLDLVPDLSELGQLLLVRACESSRVFE